MRALRAQLRAELDIALRNGEQLLLTIAIPVILLAFFSTVDVLPTGTDDPIDFLAPGVIALAVMSTAMVSLGIGTGFQRSYLVLKRLGATPLGRHRLIAAKAITVAAVEVLQLAILIPLAYALGWRPESPNWPLAVAAVLTGTSAFAGIGLLLAGRLRGEINLAAQNGVYLVLLLLGGMVIPVDELPGPLRAVANVLPSTALATVLRDALDAASTIGSSSALGVGAAWLVLAAWAVAAPALAARLFRWW